MSDHNDRGKGIMQDDDDKVKQSVTQTKDSEDNSDDELDLSLSLSLGPYKSKAQPSTSINVAAPCKEKFQLTVIRIVRSPPPPLQQPSTLRDVISSAALQTPAATANASSSTVPLPPLTRTSAVSPTILFQPSNTSSIHSPRAPFQLSSTSALLPGATPFHQSSSLLPGAIPFQQSNSHPTGPFQQSRRILLPRAVPFQQSSSPQPRTVPFQQSRILLPRTVPFQPSSNLHRRPVPFQQSSNLHRRAVPFQQSSSSLLPRAVPFQQSNSNGLLPLVPFQRSNTSGLQYRSVPFQRSNTSGLHSRSAPFERSNASGLLPRLVPYQRSNTSSLLTRSVPFQPSLTSATATATGDAVSCTDPSSSNPSTASGSKRYISTPWPSDYSPSEPREVSISKKDSTQSEYLARLPRMINDYLIRTTPSVEGPVQPSSPVQILFQKPKRRKPSPRPKDETKSKIIPVRYPWAKETRAAVHSLEYLRHNNIDMITGAVQCLKCEHVFLMEVSLEEKWRVISPYMEQYIDGVMRYQRNRWLATKLFDCHNCQRKCCVKAVVAPKKRDINWLFHMLTETLEACSSEQLKYFCKYAREHRSGDKCSLVKYTYINIYQQLKNSYDMS